MYAGLSMVLRSCRHIFMLAILRMFANMNRNQSRHKKDCETACIWDRDGMTSGVRRNLLLELQYDHVLGIASVLWSILFLFICGCCAVDLMHATSRGTMKNPIRKKKKKRKGQNKTICLSWCTLFFLKKMWVFWGFFVVVLFFLLFCACCKLPAAHPFSKNIFQNKEFRCLVLPAKDPK